MKDKKDVPDYLIILPITSPLRNQIDISKGIKVLENLMILFSLTKSSKNPYFNMVSIMNGRIKPVKSSNKKYLEDKMRHNVLILPRFYILLNLNSF